MKKALITGVTGQDGAYLAKLLLEKGYKVSGMYRRVSSPNFWRLQDLGVAHKIDLIPADLGDSASIYEAVKTADPDEIYNLAAQSYVGASFDQPLFTAQINGSATTRMLETIRHLNKNIKFYQASTSELYGDATENIQNENTVFSPASPYASAKLLSYHNTKIYRKSYGIFACNGILFNHESPLRGMEFVTRKITNSAVRIKLGLQKELFLGNVDSRRDWGYAPEFVTAMWKMLQHDEPIDFVVATGETHSVREFIEEAFKQVNLNYEDYLKTSERLFRPSDVKHLCGDPTKIKNELGWECKTKFKELVKIMVGGDLDRWKRHMNGESFPWDAQNYPDNLNIIKRYYTDQNKTPDPKEKLTPD
jgi:GDPmannose 4,6-dehydratase